MELDNHVLAMAEEALQYSLKLSGQMEDSVSTTMTSALSLADELTEFSSSTRTTVMLRNIPNKFTRDELLAVICERMLGKFDFFYLPSDFRSGCNFGYAFINMRDSGSVNQFFNLFNGVSLTFRKRGPPKVCQISYARIQGLRENVARLINSPIMGAAHVLGASQTEIDAAMPVLFDQFGQQTPFPKPDPFHLPHIMNPRASASLASPPHRKPKIIKSVGCV